MIEKADALVIFSRNMGRTESLIVAFEKIDAYNRLYQERAQRENSDIAASIRKVQASELEQITTACAEHAIISLATAFETYYSELTQELLATSPEYFLRFSNEYTEGIRQLVTDLSLHTSESIEKKLKLAHRKRYLGFYETHMIPLLVEEEKAFVEQLYELRNYFVHNTNRTEAKSETIRADLQSATELKTRAKKMRTKLAKIIPKVDIRIKKAIHDRQ